MRRFPQPSRGSSRNGSPAALGVRTRSRLLPVVACVGLAVAALSGHAPASTASSVVRDQYDFDTRDMLRTGPHSDPGGASFSLASPGRLSMTQSYSLMAQSGAGGSMSSGLYLNTLSYRLSPLLTASVDVGFHTPLHSTMPGLEQETGPGALVLPRMGLEYRPSDRWSLNLELYNGPDAFKAYGGRSGFHSPRGSRVP